MPYPVFMHEIGEIKATDVGNDPGPWHVGARKFFNLPTEDYQKYNRDGNYRQEVFNAWYNKQPKTQPNTAQQKPKHGKTNQKTTPITKK